MTESGNAQKYVAEFLGTLILVLVGCGVAVITQWSLVGFVGIALAFGFTLGALVYAIGPISGCHVNPAVTLAMFLNGKIKGKQAVFYVVMQFLGASIGAAILLSIAIGQPSFVLAENGLGQNGYGDQSPANFSMTSALVFEVVFTFIFLLVILGSTSKRATPGLAGVAIGFSLTVIHLFGIAVDGTSVNPARSFGPAIFVGGVAIEQLWLFLITPLIGAALAALLWKFLYNDKG
jgi:aquaporin Z